MITASLQQVSRVYGGPTIFRDISRAIDDGETIGLTGPSGCGKSTLLGPLAGIEEADAGEVTRRRGLRLAFLEQEQPGDMVGTPVELLMASRKDLGLIEHSLC